MPVVFILVDALRQDYLTKSLMPVCFDMASTGRWIQDVYPSWGFCERSEIFLGQTPAESGFWTAIGFKPHQSEYSAFWRALHTVEALFDERGRILIRRLFGRLARASGKKMGVANIPFDFLENFSLTEDSVPHDMPNSFGVKTVFDCLRDNSLAFGYRDTFTALGMFNGTDSDRLFSALSHTELSFQFLYLGALDAAGHVYGPGTHAISQEIGRLDSQIGDFVREYRNKRPDAKFIVLGDHGMIGVTSKIDAESILDRNARKLGLLRKRDYLYFLDSTFMRVWLLTPESRALNDALAADSELSEKGGFLTEAQMERYNLPIGTATYGDLVWAANAGVLISPDFFHVGECETKGMHGYCPDTPGIQGTLFTFGPGVARETSPAIQLHEVYDILVSEVGAPNGI